MGAAVLQLAVPCANRGGVDSRGGGAEQMCSCGEGASPLDGLQASECLSGGGLVRVPVIPLTQQEVKGSSALEYDEIKVSFQHSISPCFPPFGNFVCIMFMIVVSWPPLWSKFDINKRTFHRKKRALINT